MAGRTITIFGGSGFVGRHLVWRLARQDWTIRVGVRHPDQGLFLRTAGFPGQVALVPASVTRPGTVAAAVAGAEAVVNLVGILFERGKRSFQAVHVEGARTVAEAARSAGARKLLHISALGANPQSPSAYARTKAAGEAAVAAAFPGAVILRPSIVFGPEDHFFNRFAGMARISPFLPLVGGGRTRFQPVYVGDVADAMMRVLDEDAAAGQTYELGGPLVYTFRHLMELVLRETGRRRMLLPIPFWLASLQATFLGLLPNPPLTRDQVKLLRTDNVLSGTKPGFAELGIQPQGVEAIISTYLDRYRPHGYYSKLLRG